MGETVTYHGVCRGCGREITQRLPATGKNVARPYARFRCAECETITPLDKRAVPDQLFSVVCLPALERLM